MLSTESTVAWARANRHLTEVHDYDRLAATFAALASPIRLQLVTLLAECRRTRETPGVLELAHRAEISRFAASFHLDHLRAAGIVRRDRVGTRWAHALTQDAMDTLDEWLFDVSPGAPVSAVII